MAGLREPDPGRREDEEGVDERAGLAADAEPALRHVVDLVVALGVTEGGERVVRPWVVVREPAIDRLTEGQHGGGLMEGVVHIIFAGDG